MVFRGNSKSQSEKTTLLDLFDGAYEMPSLRFGEKKRITGEDCGLLVPDAVYIDDHLTRHSKPLLGTG